MGEACKTVHRLWTPFSRYCWYSKILHSLICSYFQVLHGFLHIRWCRILFHQHYHPNFWTWQCHGYVGNMLFYPPGQVAKTLIEAKADVQKTDSHFGFLWRWREETGKRVGDVVFRDKMFSAMDLTYIYIHYLYTLFFLHICILKNLDSSRWYEAVWVFLTQIIFIPLLGWFWGTRLAAFTQVPPFDKVYVAFSRNNGRWPALYFWCLTSCFQHFFVEAAFVRRQFQMDGNFWGTYSTITRSMWKICPSESRYQTKQVWAMPFLTAGCFALNQ